MRKLFTLLAVVLMALGVRAGELTVADGTATNQYIPFYGFFADTENLQCQTLYLQSDLSDLAGTTITALKFYSSDASVAWGSGVFEVKLAEVEENNFSNGIMTADFTTVYTGSLFVSNNEMNIAFTENFEYSGDHNLLLEIHVTTEGSYTNANFYGVTSDETASMYAYPGWTGVQSEKFYFTPKTTFTYEAAQATCVRPSKLAVSVAPDGGVFTWEGENEQYQWCIVAKDAEPASWALVEGKTYTATGLSAGTVYDFHVRSYCSATDQSKETKISFTPVCKAPNEVKLSDLTHESATFSWEAVAGIEKYQFVCLRADSAPDWTDVEAKAGLTVAVDTLQPQTSYDFYVRSWFNAETQSAATKVSFTTNCVAETLPYSESFDNSTSFPNCWEVSNKTNATWNAYPYSAESYEGKGYCVQFRGKSGQTASLQTPAINLSEPALLKVYWKNEYGVNVKLQISTDGGLTKTEIENDLSTKCSELTEKIIDLSAFAGETGVIIFEANCSESNNRYIYFDQLTVYAKPCVTPTKVKADASSTGAVVTWTAGSDESEWNLRYKAVEGTEWKEVKALAENTYTITGLVSDTEYEVQVQAACTAEKQSAWSASALFTPHCPVPTELAVKILEENSAVVAWESTESVFNLQYKAADAEDWTTVESIEAKRYELTGLEASSTYQVKVQTACGSAYTNAVSFTTRCALLADAIPYTVHMDSVAVGSMPECWFVLPSTAEVEVTLMNDDSHRMLISGDQECWVVLPALDADLSGLTVSVSWSGSALKEIGYLTAADPETFVSLATFSGSPAECDLRTASAEAKYIAFHYLGTSDYSIGYIAQVQIAETHGETAVENTTASAKATKRIENGMLIIEHNSVKYNAQGARVNK